MKSEIFPLDRVSASRLPSGDRMVKVIDDRIKRARAAPGGGDEFWHATVTDVLDAGLSVVVRRPAQAEPDPTPYPVLTGTPAVGDQVLMLSVAGSPAYCLARSGKALYGRLDPTTPYPHGPFAADPEWWTYPSSASGRAATDLEYGPYYEDSGDDGGVEGRRAFNQRALSCRVKLDSGGTVDAIVVADVWPCVTDKLELEATTPKVVYKALKPTSGDWDAFTITHKVIRVEPDFADETGGDSVAVGWGPRIQSHMGDVHTASDASFTMPINFDSKRYKDLGVERGYYRVTAEIELTGATGRNLVELALHDSLTAGAGAPYSAFHQSYSELNASTTGQQLHMSFDRVIAVHPRGPADVPPDGDPPLFWAVTQSRPSGYAMRTMYVRQFNVERINPGLSSYEFGVV